MNYDDKINICKTISQTFNSSSTYDEFLVNLDLANIDLDVAENIWKECNADIAVCIKQLCCAKYEKFSFKNIFKLNNIKNSPKINILPYKMAKLQDRNEGTIIMLYAIDANGYIMTQKLSIDLIEDMQRSCNMDLTLEFIRCLLMSW